MLGMGLLLAVPVPVGATLLLTVALLEGVPVLEPLELGVPVWDALMLAVSLLVALTDPVGDDVRLGVTLRVEDVVDAAVRELVLLTLMLTVDVLLAVMLAPGVPLTLGAMELR